MARLVRAALMEFIQPVQLLSIDADKASGAVTGRFRSGEMVFDYQIKGEQVVYGPIGGSRSDADGDWERRSRGYLMTRLGMSPSRLDRIRDLQVAHEENANRSAHHPGTVGREVVAGLMAYKPGQDLNWSIYNQNHTIPAAELEGLSPRQISAAIYTKIKGKAPGRGQAFGDWFMAPGKEKAAAAPAPATRARRLRSS